MSAFSSADASSLLITVGEDSYALPVERVHEVVRMAWLAPLVDAPPDVLGTLALRGEHVLVVDLVQRLLGRGAPVEASNVLVLVSVRGRAVACRASRVEGLVSAPVRPVGREAPSVPCVKGLLELAPPVPLLDLDALLRPELDRLADAAKEAR